MAAIDSIAAFFGFRQAPAVSDAERRMGPGRGDAFGASFDTDPERQLYDEYRGPVANPHPVLTYQLSKRGSGYTNEAISLLVETLEKDPYILGLINSRVANVLQFDSQIKQYDETEEALEAGLLIDRYYEMSGWDRVLEEALKTSLPLGISVHEAIFETFEFPLGKRRTNADSQRDRVRQWDLPVRLRQIAPERIAFDAKARLMVKAVFQSDAEAAAAGYTRSEYENWWYPNPGRVLVFTRFQDYDNPYGYPLLATLYMKAWLKRQQDIAWAQYNDRSTGPLAEAYHTAKEAGINISDTDREVVKNVVTNTLRHSGVVMPEGMRIALHELSSMSSLISYNEMIRYIDQQAAVLLVGQPSTSTTSKQGTQAQSDVHERNAHALYAADAKALERFSNQVFEMIVAMNLPKARHKAPKLNVTTKSWGEVAKIVGEVMKPGVEMGARIPEREYFRVTAIDEPLPGDRILEIKQMEAPSEQTDEKTRARRRQRERKRDPKRQKQQRDNEVN